MGSFVCLRLAWLRGKQTDNRMFWSSMSSPMLTHTAWVLLSQPVMPCCERKHCQHYENLPTLGFSNFPVAVFSVFLAFLIFARFYKHRCPFWLFCLNNRRPWFTWWFNHLPDLPGHLFSEKRTPMFGAPPLAGARVAVLPRPQESRASQLRRELGEMRQAREQFEALWATRGGWVGGPLFFFGCGHLWRWTWVVS